MIGKKQIYIAGMVVFTIGSMLCGISPSIYWLIGFRVFQAVGAAMSSALGTAVIIEAFPPKERGKAIGAGGAFVSFGIIAGPAIGGLLIELISWRWVFFVNIPIGIVGVILALRFLPNIKNAKGQRFDYRGAGTIFISQLALLLALTVGQRIGFGNPIIIGLFITCLVFLILFFMVELRFDHPLVDLKIFKNPLFGINLFNGFVSFVAIGGVIILMPFYLENVLNYHPLQVGLILAVLPVAGGIVSPIAGILSDRFGTRPIAVLGLLIMVGGYFGLTTLNAQTTTLEYILKFIPIGLGVGMFQSPNNSAIMGAAPGHRLGLVSSLLPVTRTLGNSSGIAAIGAFWVSRMAFYAGPHMTKNLAQVPIPAQVNALQETFLGVALFTTVALILAVRGLFMGKRQHIN
jgi:EmrB/QacA subfamily drug resistance transporter